VIGVVVIVFLVIHLTKSGGGNAASGSSTPSTGTTSAARAGTGGYTLTQAAKVGTSFPLNKTATKQVTPNAVAQSTAIANKIIAKKAGTPGKVTVGVYDTTTVTSITSSAYRGIIFVGYEGTFNPAAVIKIERSLLVSSRVVKAGPHGGAMVCGYSRTTGTDASECVWATKTTFGIVEYFNHGQPAKVTNASRLALKVRAAVEARAQ
jgi:hypothetical protein